VTMSNEPTAPEEREPGPFFHGTKADLKPGDLLEAGYSSNFGQRRKANFLYLTATLDAATWGAELAVGEEASGKVVTRVRMEAQLTAHEAGLPLVIVDGSPGTGCPVIASLSGADLTLIITEPSLSGLHDLERILQVAVHFGIPTIVGINKCDIVPELADRIRRRCGELGIEVAAEIPFSGEVVEALRGGQPPVGNVPPEVEEPLRRLARVIEERTAVATG